MRVLTLEKGKEDVIMREVIAVLKNGGAVVLPTDTVYGLAVDALNESALERLFQIKGRSFAKTVPVFISDVEMLRTIARVDEKIYSTLFSFWPGALTALLFAKEGMPRLITGDTPVIGVRIPDHAWLLELIRSFGGPITGTSANTAGRGPYHDIKDVMRDFSYFGREPDIIIDAAILLPSKPSTVVDFTKHTPIILREGAIAKADLESLFQTYF